MHELWWTMLREREGESKCWENGAIFLRARLHLLPVSISLRNYVLRNSQQLQLVFKCWWRRILEPNSNELRRLQSKGLSNWVYETASQSMYRALRNIRSVKGLHLCQLLSSERPHLLGLVSFRSCKPFVVLGRRQRDKVNDWQQVVGHITRKLHAVSDMAIRDTPLNWRVSC